MMRGNSSSMFRKRLTRFYEAYNPSQMHKIDEILEAYEGEEEQLFEDLISRYGPEPEEEEEEVDPPSAGVLRKPSVLAVASNPRSNSLMQPPSSSRNASLSQPPSSFVGQGRSASPLVPPPTTTISQSQSPSRNVTVGPMHAAPASPDGWSETILVDVPPTMDDASPIPMVSSPVLPMNASQHSAPQRRYSQDVQPLSFPPPSHQHQELEVSVGAGAWQRPQQQQQQYGGGNDGLGTLFTSRSNTPTTPTVTGVRSVGPSGAFGTSATDVNGGRYQKRLQLLREHGEHLTAAAPPVRRLEVYRSMVSATTAVMYRHDPTGVANGIARQMMRTASDNANGRLNDKKPVEVGRQQQQNQRSVQQPSAVHNSNNTQKDRMMFPSLAQRLTQHQQVAQNRTDLHFAMLEANTSSLDHTTTPSSYYHHTKGRSASPQRYDPGIDADLLPPDVGCLPSTLNIDEVASYQHLARRSMLAADKDAIHNSVDRSNVDHSNVSMPDGFEQDEELWHAASPQRSGGLYFRESVRTTVPIVATAKNSGGKSAMLSSSPLVTQERILVKDRAARVEQIFQDRRRRLHDEEMIHHGGVEGPHDKEDPMHKNNNIDAHSGRRMIQVICVECGFITMADPVTMEVKGHRH
jgi:hypothetical protein